VATVAVVDAVTGDGCSAAPPTSSARGQYSDNMVKIELTLTHHGGS